MEVSPGTGTQSTPAASLRHGSGRSNSGSRAMLMAILCASSAVSTFACRASASVFRE
jgi:hypothetical protein